MNTNRADHTATLLPNGKVLVAGGTTTDGILASAELYDPGTGTWAITGVMTTNRHDHTATLLPDGKVLVVGGISYVDGHVADMLSSAELYDPETGTWRTTGGLHGGHAFHTATLLLNGKVLLVGDPTHREGPSVELYDPAREAWTATGTMIDSRTYHTATLLPNGDVLVAGGLADGSALHTAELYHPGTERWTAAGSTLSAHYDNAAALLPNGRVLVTSGYSELYDWATPLWTVTGRMVMLSNEPLRSERFTATLLPCGKVLATGGEKHGGGYVFGSAELYDPTLGTWERTGPLNAERSSHTATLLLDGKVLVAGGFNFVFPGGFDYLSSAELYDSTNAIVDAGLRAYDGTAVIRFACESALQPASPLRFSKNLLTYSILLTPTNSPDASKFRIQTASGVKAFMKLP